MWCYKKLQGFVWSVLVLDKIKSIFNRRLVQALSLVGSNSYLQGFMQKTIYKGNTKGVCVPFLNCYSCPGARFSCPIGSLQAVLGKRNNYFSFYVIGFLVLMGILFGRFICGFLCPFGFVQDMIAKISKKKYKALKLFKYIKYINLVLLVILLPLFFTNSVGVGTPYFCKYVCPVGTLEGGIFLVAVNSALRNTIGFLYYYKVTMLIAILVSSVFIYRPFCKVLCPLGALYALFNRISLVNIKFEMYACVSCGKCEKTCQMDVVPFIDANNMECIRCGKCIKACPTKALSFNTNKKRKEKRDEQIIKIPE